MLGTVDAAVLLVGEEREHEVALRGSAGAQQVGGGREDHRVHVLHVHGAAAPEHPVADLPRERIDRPVRGIGGDHVEVAMDDEGRLLGVAARDASDDARATRVGVDQLRSEAELTQVRGDVLGRLLLRLRLPLPVVRRVEADEITGDADGLVGLEIRQVAVVRRGGHATTLPAARWGVKTTSESVLSSFLGARTWESKQLARVAELADALA